MRTAAAKDGKGQNNIPCYYTTSTVCDWSISLLTVERISPELFLLALPSDAH